MTDRIHSITIVLDRDMRIDDAESLLKALRHFRNVIDVIPNVADTTALMAEARARRDATDAMLEAVEKMRRG